MRIKPKKSSFISFKKRGPKYKYTRMDNKSINTESGDILPLECNQIYKYLGLQITGDLSKAQSRQMLSNSINELLTKLDTQVLTGIQKS